MSSTGDVFKALADPTRREILRILKDGEQAAGDIAEQFAMSGPSVSRHLSILATAGLIQSRRDANRILYSLCSQPIVETLNDFLSGVCPTQIRRRKRSRKKKGRS